MESNSACDVIFSSEFLFESGFLSITPTGSLAGDGLRDICAKAVGSRQEAESSRMHKPARKRVQTGSIPIVNAESKSAFMRYLSFPLQMSRVASNRALQATS